MTRKLSKRSQTKIKELLGVLDEISLMANAMSEESLTDLVRRDAIGIGHDGLPSNSMPEFSSGGGFGGSSTESAALRGLPGEKSNDKDDWNRRDAKAASADDVRRNLNIVTHSLKDARQSLKEAANALNYVALKDEEVRGRQASDPCEICGVQAAQKAGWCVEHYNEWINEGKPDRSLWRMWKRGDKNREGDVLVTSKPKSRQ